jgi:glucose-1-phosphate thymidylyltransferase
MHALVLAGGFAKRLWPLTKDKPKPLLEVGGKPMIEHVIDKIEKVDEIDKIFISTNDKFDVVFNKWLKGFKSKKEIELIIEPTQSEGEKLGSIGGIEFFLQRERVKDDLLIVAGDNLFEFDLKGMFDFYKKKKSPVIGLHDIKDFEQAKKLGTVEIDKNGKVVGFYEKSPNPKTTLASTLIYLLPKSALDLIPIYLKETNNPDTPGYFLIWLYKNHPLYGYIFPGEWHDIGSFEELKRVQEKYKR